jgi:hypothetical protein
MLTNTAAYMLSYRWRESLERSTCRLRKGASAAAAAAAAVQAGASALLLHMAAHQRCVFTVLVTPRADFAQRA